MSGDTPAGERRLIIAAVYGSPDTIVPNDTIIVATKLITEAFAGSKSSQLSP